MKVTMYKEHYIAPRISRLDTIIKIMQSGQREKTIIAFRKELAFYTPGVRIPETKKPPLILFAGIFYKEAGRYETSDYNGIILVNIDKLANQAEADDIRRKASESLQTLAAFTGSSGRSVKILIRFTLPDGSLPTGKEQVEKFHAHAYYKAVRYFRMQLQRNISIKQPVPARGCRLSYDPHLYYHSGAATITMEQPLDMPCEETWLDKQQQEINPLDRMLPGIERSRQISLLYEAALKETLNTLPVDIDQNDPKQFLVRLATNCFRSGIPEEETIRWSSFHSELADHHTEFRATIRNIYQTGKGFAKHPCLSPVQQMAFQLEEFMQRRYQLRRNEVKKEVEYRERGSYYFHFKPVTEEVLNTFSIQAHLEGLDFWDRDIKRYTHSYHIPVYNPINDYLDHLPEWDGMDYIRKLAGTIPTCYPEWPDYFFRWFLGMVAQWKQMNGLHAHSMIPLLIGKQACGKSTWCRRILPPVLQDFFTDNLDMNNKRNAELALNRFLLINLDEFDSISNNRQPFLKHLIQKPEIKVRRPHQSSIESLKRYASFIATCNNHDLLTDPTGSRRFLCIEVQGTIDYHTPIHYDQLYSQAIHLLRTGERHWFTREEEKTIMLQNKAFEQITPEEELLLVYFRPVNHGEEGEWRSATEILQYICKRSYLKPGNIYMKHFGRILIKNKFLRKHTLTGNKYHVKEIRQ